MKQLQAINLLLSDCRGVKIPQDFYNNFDLEKWHIKKSYFLNNLNNYSSENYWNAWEEVLNGAYYLDDNGNKFVLYQDGDLFGICYEIMTDSERLEFFGED